jgi:hypothetical protein
MPSAKSEISARPDEVTRRVKGRIIKVCPSTGEAEGQTEGALEIEVEIEPHDGDRVVAARCAPCGAEGSRLEFSALFMVFSFNRKVVTTGPCLV